MTYEVDQSGKIENTSVCTVFAYSNGSKNYLYLKPVAKRTIQRWFSTGNKGHVYIYKTFACALYLMIKRFKLKGTLKVDIEYPGNMSLIKSFLFRIFKKYNYNTDNIDLDFELIGKKSEAHTLAINVYRSGKYSKENSVIASEVFKLLSDI